MSGKPTYRRLLAGGGIVTLGNMAAAGLGLVLLLFLARTLPPAELALVVGVIAVIDGGQMLLDGMINTGMINLASRNGTKGAPSPDLLRAGFWSKLAAGLAYAGLAALLAHPLSVAMLGDGSMAYLVGLAGVAAVLAAMNGFTLAVLTAHEAFERIALVSLWKNLFRILGVAPFLWGETPDAHGAALAICAVTVVTFLAGATLMPWGFLRASAPLWRGVRTLLGVNGWLALAALGMLGGRLDVWLVGFLSDAHQAGLYAVAAQLCVGVGVITQAMVTTLLPTVSRFGSPAETRNFLIRSTRTLVPICLLPLLAWPVAEPAIALIFGAAYAGSAATFVMLFVAAVMTLVSAPLMLVLLSMGEARILALGTLAQLALRVAMAFPLVPRNGAIGLAWADILSRLIAMAAIVAIIRKTLRRDMHRATPEAGPSDGIAKPAASALSG